MPIRESFWIDELHSTWAVSGLWNEVAERSILGNQSPFYFLLLKGWYSVWGSLFSSEQTVEIVLRSFSWIGWIGTLAYVFYLLESAWSASPGADSKDNFASVEATSPQSRRIATKSLQPIFPSRWVAVVFVSLALLFDRVGIFYAIELRPYVWVALACLGMVAISARMMEQPQQIRFSWILLAMIAFYLHYTAILVIIANIISIEVGVLFASQ